LSIYSYLAAAPKAELHVHFQGSLRPATLLTLAQRNRVPLPATDEAGLRSWFTYRDFPHFASIYDDICRCLRTAADYELVTYELGADLARQNVRYAEVTFTPGEHERTGVPNTRFFDGLTRGRAKVRRDFGVEINWVFDIVRDALLREAHADYVLGAAIDGKSDGVVALGLGGPEVGNPPEWFAPWFDWAREAGLHSDPHAGETVGPSSVWGALRALGAERIGHGVRSIEDRALVNHLAEHRIPLEINPTSNVRLGIYPDLAAHPLRALHELGVIVTVNSDDPPLFNTTLNEEVATLASAFGFDTPTIDEILLNGIRHAFLPPERRQALEAAFRSELQTLKPVHLVPI
jgi:adenosine deaminase